MHSVQLKLDDEYNDKLQSLCRRFGVTKTELVRFMLDTIQDWEVSDVEFERWYSNHKRT